MTSPAPVDDVVDVLVTTLGIESRRESIDVDTPLFGSLPELDSLGVVELTAALEDRFGFVVDDAEFDGEIFTTVGTLSDFVASKTATS